MKTVLALVVLSGATLADKAAPITLSFDADVVDREPRGFELARTGDGKLGKWVVRAAGGRSLRCCV